MILVSSSAPLYTDSSGTGPHTWGPATVECGCGVNKLLKVNKSIQLYWQLTRRNVQTWEQHGLNSAIL